jgi:hypothetical protein
MIVQVPSEANAEQLICTRLRDANDEGWTVTQMMDHNGFLVLLLEAADTPREPECATCGDTRLIESDEPCGKHGREPVWHDIACPDCAPSGASPTTSRED